MSLAATAVDHATYRADIDGLRAIAVLAVIAYHVDARWLQGGFIGVDIFFVISGFLITGNLIRADGVSAGHADRARELGARYARFLAGRVRRLAPALLLVIAATLVATQWLLRPEDARAAAESALWSLASAANLYFWLRVDHGYFAPSSAEQPLLHLWSLGVEEQFYLLWPLVLVLCVLPLQRRFGAVTATATVIALAVASLVLGVAAAGAAPDFAYYALPTRASGLLTGAVLALVLTPRAGSWHATAGAADLHGARAEPAAIVAPRRSSCSSRCTWEYWRRTVRSGRSLREAMAWSGAILVGGSAVQWTDEATAYPGIAVLWPTAGAALLLLAGSAWPWSAGNDDPAARSHSLTRLLASRPLVSIGQVSYAAYLWHWPVLAFYRYGHGAPGPGAGIALVAAILVLAAASTYLVEQPLRRGRAAPGRTALTLLIAPGLALACVGAFILGTGGFGARAWSPPYVAAWQRVHGGSRSSEDDPAVCQHARLRPADLQARRCVGGAREANAPTVLLWGDSHAAHFVATLSQIGAAGGFRVRNIAHYGCPPVLVDPVRLIQRRDLAACRASLETMAAVLPAHRDVIIAASWYSYRYRAPDFHARFEQTLRILRSRGIRVTLIGRIPLMPGFDRLCEEKSLTYPGMSCPAPRVRMQAIVAQDNAWLGGLAAKHPGVAYFDPTPYLCPAAICAAHDRDGTLLYFDSNHLSIAGSQVLGERILRAEGVPAAFRHMGRAARVVSTAAAADADPSAAARRHE